MYVKERFYLNDRAEDRIRSLVPPFGYNGFGEVVFYRTYSRIKLDGGQEDWADCVVRVINGTFSIRKNHYAANRIPWDENRWQEYAARFGEAMHQMRWLPPGRGLWAMGSDFVYQRGAMALYNCAATNLSSAELGADINWLMDCLMHGVGVGFSPLRDDSLELHQPRGIRDFVIPDSREGWCDCTQAIIVSYLRPGMRKIRPIYDLVRPAGLPIRGFGGVSSGPEPLRELHEMIVGFLERYRESREYDSVRLKMDLANAVGCCVVSGNVRRSAELACLSINDPTFRDMKNYKKYPERGKIGYMSNNSVLLDEDRDFQMLGEIARRVIKNGEPGYINLRNLPLARIGKKMRGLPKDRATILNPCQPGWAKVLTPAGIRELGEVGIGDLIWSETGWTRIINKVSTGVNKVYRYGTQASVFYGTEKHEVVSNSFKIPVKLAESIDVLRASPIPGHDHDAQSIIDGMIIGDGTDHHGTILLNVGRNDSDVLVDFPEYLTGPYSKEYQYKVQTTICSAELPVTYLRSVPERFLKAQGPIVASFLRGLFSANGSLCGNRVTLKAASKMIVEQVQLMLSSIGIRSYYTTNKSKVVEFQNGRYRCKESYDLQIAQDRELFARNVGFVQAYKQKALEALVEKISKFMNYKGSYEITSVELISEEETFDITVDNWTHTYWTQGCNVSNCGEVPLEDKEVCNVDETLPTMCENERQWLEACGYAAFYCSTVSLLPTHQPATNRIVARNRRIAVSIVDWTGWKHRHGMHNVIRWMREGYDEVRRTNRWANNEAGVPVSIRVTTVKPGGTVPKLPGRTPGIGHPNFAYTLRRMRVAKNAPIHPFLVAAGLRYEEDVVDKYTDVFEYPILQGPAKPAEEVSLWEQAMNLVTVQREWSDNAVSNTLNFRPMWPLVEHADGDFQEVLAKYVGLVTACEIIMNERCSEYCVPGRYKIVIGRHGDGDVACVDVHEFDPRHEECDIEPVLSAIAPVTKTVSLLPHSAKGAYRQMPEEGISEEEYRERLAELRPIDWSEFGGSDGVDEQYCNSDACEIRRQ